MNPKDSVPIAIFMGISAFIAVQAISIAISMSRIATAVELLAKRGMP